MPGARYTLQSIARLGGYTAPLAGWLLPGQDLSAAFSTLPPKDAQAAIPRKILPVPPSKTAASLRPPVSAQSQSNDAVSVKTQGHWGQACLCKYSKGPAARYISLNGLPCHRLQGRGSGRISRPCLVASGRSVFSHKRGMSGFPATSSHQEAGSSAQGKDDVVDFKGLGPVDYGSSFGK
ncbi:hypothetical protein NDU88_003953 [Pleurodeles waltl]|uniref:Uncharacterized protein n=1 Tax=Pleurodeles waltl TaxID=8319 RepID=A0AAV7V1J5_PLEWA|nr:hypothetical protein NDU88_003953 [Pleurodeles waltl]